MGIRQRLVFIFEVGDHRQQFGADRRHGVCAAFLGLAPLEILFGPPPLFLTLNFLAGSSKLLFLTAIYARRPQRRSARPKHVPYSHSKPLESHKSELHADWRNLIDAGQSTSSAGDAAMRKDDNPRLGQR